MRPGGELTVMDRFDSQVSSTAGETNGWFCHVLPALQKLERLSVSDQVVDRDPKLLERQGLLRFVEDLFEYGQDRVRTPVPVSRR
jgi:hypothetical protein